MSSSARIWQVASALLLSAVALAADTVSGYVLDAEKDARLADVEVAFLVAGEAGLAEIARHNTDAEGAFSFSGPFLSAGTSFGLIAHYGELEYATDVLEVGGQDQVTIEVFDGTGDDRQIRIDGHNLFLALTETGVDVAQLVHIDNQGASTYMGQATNDGRRVFQLQVPEGNFALQGHSGQVLRGSPTRLFTEKPLPPGRSQIAFKIQLSGDDFGGVYEHEILYPTGRLELFLQPTSIDLPAALFQDQGTIQLHDQRYRHYRVVDLSPGRTVSIPLPLSRPLRWALKWGMLVFVLAALAAASSMTKSTGAVAHQPNSPHAERQLLITQLAQIDDHLAAGEDKALRRQRGELKKRVARLYRHLV